MAMNIQNTNNTHLPEPIISLNNFQSNEGHLDKEKKGRMNKCEPMQINSDDNMYRIVLTKSKIVYESRPQSDKVEIKPQEKNQDINKINDSINSNFEGHDEDKGERFPDVVSYHNYLIIHSYFFFFVSAFIFFHWYKVTVFNNYLLF